MDLAAIILQYLETTWKLTSEIAPYLLLGFIIAGLLRSFFDEQWVRRHLGQRGLAQILKAVVIGVPLPLCSCGVIPVAAGIRRQGGQPGAVAAFTAATPQTGVDSIAATVGMLGWPFAILRVLVAFINGLVAGLAVERWGDRQEGEGHNGPDGPRPASPASPSSPSCPSALARLREGVRFGLITLPRDLSWALIIGLLVAGAIGSLAPEDLFMRVPGGKFGLYVLMTFISLPLYVCSTGSIPMAFSFLQAGMNPGAVIIFLIAGPASSSATLTSLWKIIGGRATMIYVLSIIATAWVAALVVDFSGLSILVTHAVHQHDSGVGLFQQAAAGVLVLLLLVGRLAGKKMH